MSSADDQRIADAIESIRKNPFHGPLFRQHGQGVSVQFGKVSDDREAEFFPDKKLVIVDPNIDERMLSSVIVQAVLPKR